MAEKLTGEKLLLDLLDGFIKSKVLMVGYKIGLFTLIAKQPLPEPQIRERLGLPERSSTILIQACVALGLITQTDRGLKTADHVADYLVSGGDGPFRPTSYLIGYYDEVYRALADMEDLVRTDGASSTFRLRDYFKDDVSTVDPGVAKEYSKYMDATIAEIVKVVLDTYSFARHSLLLDLCGGTGSFSAAVVRATPGLKAAFIDVPACVEIGKRRLADEPALAGRLQPIAGDVFTSPFPAGSDVITICRAAMDWGDERILGLYRRVHEALPKNGRFLIVERMLPEEVQPEARALFLRSIYFLAKSTTTRYRTPKQHVSLLERAGFRSVEVLEPLRAPYEQFQSMRIVAGAKS